MAQRLDFSWRCQPCRGSTNFTLFKYLKSHPRSSRSQLIITAINAFYYPKASQAILEDDPKKLEKLARDSIFALLKQINEICVECGVDKNQIKDLLAGCFGDSSSSVPSMPTQEKTEPTEEVEIIPKFDPSLLSFGNFMIKREFR